MWLLLMFYKLVLFIVASGFLLNSRECKTRGLSVKYPTSDEVIGYSRDHNQRNILLLIKSSATPGIIISTRSQMRTDILHPRETPALVTSSMYFKAIWEYLKALLRIVVVGVGPLLLIPLVHLLDSEDC